MGEGLTSFNCADWRRYDALQRLAGANAAAVAEHSPMLWTELAAGASRQRANGCAEAYFTEARWRGTCLRELRRARYANGARPKRGHRGLCTCARTELLRARVVGFFALSHAKVGHPRRRAAPSSPRRAC